MDDFWKGAEVISTYTRAQAIEDGVLGDVSDVAREAGFTCPVAVTTAVWSMIEDIPPRFKGIQDVQGRLWDVLWMCSRAAKRGGQLIHFDLIMHHGRQKYAKLKAHAGPGDNRELVITIMLPDED